MGNIEVKAAGSIKLDVKPDNEHLKFGVAKFIPSSFYSYKTLEFEGIPKEPVFFAVVSPDIISRTLTSKPVNYVPVVYLKYPNGAVAKTVKPDKSMVTYGVIVEDCDPSLFEYQYDADAKKLTLTSSAADMTVKPGKFLQLEYLLYYAYFERS